MTTIIVNPNESEEELTKNIGLFGLISNLMSSLISNDIFGIYRNPTGYMMETGKIHLIEYRLIDTDSRMERLGYIESNGIRYPVYKYCGTFDEFEQEVVRYSRSAGTK